MKDQSAQRLLAVKAFEKKAAGLDDGGALPTNQAAANEGMIATPREDYPPSGAFDAEGREPALRRSRGR